MTAFFGSEGTIGARAIRSSSNKDAPPEPPNRYRFDAEIEKPVGTFTRNTREPDAESVRRLITVSVVMTIVSLFIGGVFLSAAACVVAFMAHRKACMGLLMQTGMNVNLPAWLTLKRSSSRAIVISAIALAINAVVLIAVYPSIIEMIQTSSYAPSSAGLSNPSYPGNSTWG